MGLQRHRRRLDPDGRGPGGGALGSLVVGIASGRLGSLLAGMYVLVIPMVAGGLLTLRARASFERDAHKVME
ncbi:hypothetical protein [Actinomadura sp. 6N118]|uniref:hypothetical protein n=1 Tax=Actinomadura sp. 6N118 TaxID=3375151 RepID=UPI0037AC16E0